MRQGLLPDRHFLLRAFARSALGWTRNNFDRLAHFLFGFCITPAIVSHAMHRHKRNARSAFYITPATVVIASLCGQQGDMWDAHKDMLMATLGCLAWARHYLRKKPTTV